VYIQRRREPIHDLLIEPIDAAVGCRSNMREYSGDVYLDSVAGKEELDLHQHDDRND
jgi:hypothetical protein